FIPDASPTARTQITLSLNGATSTLAPHVVGSQTYYYPQNGTLQLVAKQASSTLWVAYDGDGVTYSFTIPSPSLLGGAGMFLLTRIDGPSGAFVALSYAIGAPTVPGGGTGVSIDLAGVSYNNNPSTPGCYKAAIFLVYFPSAATPYSM